MFDGKPMMHLIFRAGVPIEIGRANDVLRRCVPILDGTMSGDYSGFFLPGGADWQEIQPDGTVEIDARYILQAEQGVIEVHSQGVRTGPPDVLKRLTEGKPVPVDRYYYRTAIRFVTGATELVHLNTLLGIAIGERGPDWVDLKIYRVT